MTTTKLADWTRRTHKIELMLYALGPENLFMPDGMARFFRQTIIEVQMARMYGGDCLRLMLLGDKAHGMERFVPADHGATWEGDLVGVGLDTIVFQDMMRENIMELKLELRAILYEVLEYPLIVTGYVDSMPVLMKSSYRNTEELELYRTAFMMHLKQTDQQLGLCLGVLNDEI